MTLNQAPLRSGSISAALIKTVTLINAMERKIYDALGPFETITFQTTVWVILRFIFFYRCK